MNSELIYGLSDEIYEEYKRIEQEECESMVIEFIRPVKETLPKLLGKLNSTNVLIRKLEYKLMDSELEYEQELIRLKREAMDGGMKSTEAKEWAKTQTVKLQKQLIQLENDLNLLKDHKKYMEKQLKYRFMELQKEWFELEYVQIADGTSCRVDKLESELEKLQKLLE